MRLLFALTGLCFLIATSRAADVARSSASSPWRPGDAASSITAADDLPTMPSAAAPPSAASRAFATLNETRLRSGAGALQWSAALAAAATRHAAYLDTNGLRSASTLHAETLGLQEFTGTDPFARMRAAGYRLSYATEVVGDVGSSSPEGHCVEDLLDTVYHAALLLSRVTQAGLAFGATRYAGMCIIDLGAPLEAVSANVPAAGQAVTFPFPGMTVHDGTYRVSSENPRPSVALLPAALAGTPVLVGFRNADYLRASSTSPRVNIDAFTIADASGQRLPAVILAEPSIAGEAVNADESLQGGFAVLVPMRPLSDGRYFVTLHARVSCGESLMPMSWWFDVKNR